MKYFFGWKMYIYGVESRLTPPLLQASQIWNKNIPLITLLNRAPWYPESPEYRITYLNLRKPPLVTQLLNLPSYVWYERTLAQAPGVMILEHKNLPQKDGLKQLFPRAGRESTVSEPTFRLTALIRSDVKIWLTKKSGILNSVVFLSKRKCTEKNVGIS